MPAEVNTLQSPTSDLPLVGEADVELMERVRSKQAKIAVLGMGHVGLPTALSLAEMGWKVLGADNAIAQVERLRARYVPFYEPGLSELLDKHLGNNFIPVDDLEAAIREATILFICVGTPQRENGEADLSQVESVAHTIALNLNAYKLIVEKSTVPAVTAEWVKRTILRYAKAVPNGNGSAGEIAFDVASNPEFLQEGIAVRNLFYPDRVVCGVESDRAKAILQEIYRPLNAPVLITGLSTAEIIKHAANSFLAMKISFVNMVADLCEVVGADVTQVAAGLGMDARISPGFLKAGIGFGGYCFPKDLRAFIHLAEEFGLNFSLLREVEAINQQRVEVFLKKVRKALWVLRGKTLAVFGLAFKPGTDDTREAPSMKIIERLLAEGASLRLHDPRAIPILKQSLPEKEGSIKYCEDPYEAAKQAHAVLLLTEWPEYRALDLTQLRSMMEVPVVVDGRNIFDPAQMREAGFEYISVGR